jgi:hypothetical protein
MIQGWTNRFQKMICQVNDSKMELSSVLFLLYLSNLIIVQRKGMDRMIVAADIAMDPILKALFSNSSMKAILTLKLNYVLLNNKQHYKHVFEIHKSNRNMKIRLN